jgi:ligand-binding sensor domain-containing protein
MKILKLIILLFVPIILHSQGTWTYYTKKDGLISDKVFGGVVDKKGNIWFNGTEGIMQFNGKIWISYKKLRNWKFEDKLFLDSKDNVWLMYIPLVGFGSTSINKHDGNNFASFDITQLNCDNISVIKEDSKGRMWFGGSCGEKIGVYDGENWFNYSNKDGLAKWPVTNIFEDSKGNIWVTTGATGEGAASALDMTISFTSTGGFISKYDGKKWTSFEDEKVINRIGLANTTIFEDSKGNIWLGGSNNISQSKGIQFGALLKYDGDKWLSYTSDIGDDMIFAIMEDSRHYIWATSLKFAYMFDGTRWTAWGTGPVLSIMEDDSANIWVGTSYGIGKYDGKNRIYYKPKDGFSYVKKIIEDKNGNVWFAGDGLYLYKNNDWYMKDNKPCLLDSEINDIVEDLNGNIWVCTKKGVIKIEQ